MTAMAPTDAASVGVATPKKMVPNMDKIISVGRVTDFKDFSF